LPKTSDAANCGDRKLIKTLDQDLHTPILADLEGIRGGKAFLSRGKRA
jgi:hypothetical protein